MARSATLPTKIKSSGYQFTNSDGTTTKDIYQAATGTAPDGGAVIQSLVASSTDTSARDLLLYLYDGTTARLLATISIPANSGNTNALPPLNLLTHAMLAAALPKDSNGNPVLFLEQGHKLQGAMGATITSAKLVSVVPMGAEH